MFYDKLFSSLDFTLPRAATGRRGFPKEAMVCAFIVMKCEGFSQITDLADYLDNNRLIAHYCGFNIMLIRGREDLSGDGRIGDIARCGQLVERQAGDAVHQHMTFVPPVELIPPLIDHGAAAVLLDV